MSGSGPARTLVEHARTAEADLVIVASHGQGGARRVREVPLGSVPERLLSDLECPLLIVPAIRTLASADGIARAARLVALP